MALQQTQMRVFRCVKSAKNQTSFDDFSLNLIRLLHYHSEIKSWMTIYKLA